MARENQGLQIALIVFVMLTIVLGVTTYLFFRQWDEADLRAKTNLAAQQKSAKEAADFSRELDELKRMVGLAKQDKADGVFADDMKKYGSGYPEVSHFYRPLVEKMQKTIDEKKEALAIADAKIKKLEEDFRVREANKDPQIKAFEQDRDNAKKELASEQEKLKSDRDRISSDAAKLNTDLAATRKAAEASVAAREQKLKEATTKMQQLVNINAKLTSDVEGLTSENFEVALGDIRWVNQRTGTVWINLGSADALRRQVTFGVYPSNARELAGGSKKASIEVTQILGDHLAEARVFDDKVEDPILPGDKIFTPVWTPNETRHFAVAGYVDLDRDGKSDVQTVRDVVAMNGGVVDAYIDESGKLVGAITPNTRYLVVGEKPTEKGPNTMRVSFTKIQTDAKFYGVQEIQVADLLRQMGWQNTMNVAQYGAGAKPADFAPTLDGGVQKKSIGGVSDVFKQRAPGRSASGR